MVFNPSLYEINTRVWLRQFDTPDKRATFKDIPDTYWIKLAEKGIDYVWLMGIWKTTPSTVEKYCFESNLVEAYKKALPDWKKEDVIGSPYAIDCYQINPQLGTEAELAELREQLKKHGIKLILDFVSNHFSADTSLLHTNPNIFLSAYFESYKSEWSTFYKPLATEKDLYFAHGRDPYFPAWKDTVQVNYFNEEARTFMIDSLLNIAKICDGVRCDMAMLNINDVFEKTWGGVLSSQGFKRAKDEFWKVAISTLKRRFPDCVMIAEVYWDMEWILQQQGFDYTYDKKLTARLETGNQFKIRGHLNAEHDYQMKSVRFIENHDEQRAAVTFNSEKGKAAAIIMSTLQGMRFYHDGQWEGFKTHLPMQLGRAPFEVIDQDIKAFYDHLLQIIKEPVFKNGSWEFLESLPSWTANDTFNNIFAWEWRLGKERRLVTVNYADVMSSCRLALDVKGYGEKILFKDILNNETYPRSTVEVNEEGLYIQLDKYRSHIFSF
ncbi:MAG: alpha-amylase family glycosyl hydrolase [Bdellovibrionota bacterium]|jgi:hypothetical protein